MKVLALVVYLLPVKKRAGISFSTGSNIRVAYYRLNRVDLADSCN